MRWTQVSCLNCRLTNSCFHVFVFLSDEIFFLFVFFGGKKIKCPRSVAVIRSTLCWAAACRAAAALDSSSSLFPWRFSFEFSSYSTCLFFSEWLLYFLGINFFSFGVHESRAPGKIDHSIRVIVLNLAASFTVFLHVSALYNKSSVRLIRRWMFYLFCRFHVS